jgi:hypothetical protein
MSTDLPPYVPGPTGLPPDQDLDKQQKYWASDQQQEADIQTQLNDPNTTDDQKKTLNAQLATLQQQDVWIVGAIQDDLDQLRAIGNRASMNSDSSNQSRKSPLGPVLSLPMNLTPDTASLILEDFNDVQQNLFTNVRMQDLTNAHKKMQDQHQMILDKIKDALKKTIESHKHDNTNSILKWFKRIAPIVIAAVAVVATVATLGAASPLAGIALAAMAYSIANEVSADAGGPAIGPQLLADGFSKALTDMGVAPDQAKAFGTLMSATAAIAIGAAFVDPSVGGQLLIGASQVYDVETHTADNAQTDMILNAVGTGVTALAAAVFLGKMTPPTSLVSADSGVAMQLLKGGLTSGKVMTGVQVSSAVLDVTGKLADDGASIWSALLNEESAGFTKAAADDGADTKVLQAGVQQEKTQISQDNDDLKAAIDRFNANWDRLADIISQSAETKDDMINAHPA